MTEGIYEYTYANGDKARWVREPGGRIRYWVGGKWKFYLDPDTWNKVVAAMAGRPLHNDDVPIVGEVTGYRCWRVFGSDLWALHRRYRWLPGETETGHVGDDMGGIHAFKSLSRAVSEADDDEWDIPIAVGSVAMWGDAIEAADGWRAEYAKILSIDYVFGDSAKQSPMWKRLIHREPSVDSPDEILRKLRRVYGLRTASAEDASNAR